MAAELLKAKFIIGKESILTYYTFRFYKVTVWGSVDCLLSENCIQDCWFTIKG